MKTPSGPLRFFPAAAAAIIKAFIPVGVILAITTNTVASASVVEIHSEEPRAKPEARKFLRIATWHLESFPAGHRGGTGEHADWHTAAAAHLINRMEPDILAVQGVRDMDALRTLNRNLGRRSFPRLALAPSSPQVAGPQSGRHAFLARHPESETWTVSVSDTPGIHWLAAKFPSPAGELVIYQISLDAESPHTARAGVLEALRADLHVRGIDPYRDRILVVGGFGADIFAKGYESDPTLPTMRSTGFEHTFDVLRRSANITLPSVGGDSAPATMDYIWMSAAWGRPLPAAVVLQEGAPDQPNARGGDRPGWASRHFPLYVDIAL